MPPRLRSLTTAIRALALRGRIGRGASSVTISTKELTPRCMVMQDAPTIMRLLSSRALGLATSRSIRRAVRSSSIPKQTSFRSSWQNGVAERWVGSCRTALEPGETLSLHLLFGRVYDFWQIKAADLGFSCCIGDAYSLLRDGIEFTAHAHKIFNEPVVTKAWAEKMQGKTQTGAYDKICNSSGVRYAVGAERVQQSGGD